MIIYRYLAREIFYSTFAVGLVLVPIIVSSRLVRLLSNAVDGDASLIFVAQMIFYRLPSMLMLIIPLALFLGVLLAYGRLYLESEIAVLRASGASSRKLLMFAMGPAFCGALIVGSFSLYVSPLAWQELEKVYAEQDSLNELDKLTAGRFQSLPGGGTAYTSGFSDNRRQLEQVFLSQVDRASGSIQITLADSGRQQNNDRGQRYLVLENGRRYSGQPGELTYETLEYREYGYLLPERKVVLSKDEASAKTSVELLASDNLEDLAELQWRLSLPVLALIVVLIAVPLSHANPRQGRYARLIPSILLYLAYVTLLTTAKDEIEKGASIIYIWMVHLGFLMYGLSLVYCEHFWTEQFNRLPKFNLPARTKE
ncbi:MAG: LPS export ABC transporter permease LptF [Pseudomonadales bacterium]